MQLLRPDSLEAAVAALGNGSVALGGGTDLVPLLRDRIVEADTLVELRSVVPRGVHGTTVGAGTTLAELEVDPEIPAALREACTLAASPQLRSMGTIGGNLLQATRCWYWRLKYPCFLHGGDRCHAREGAHREHAILGNERCASAHPSDPAAALLALGATLRTDRRELAIERALPAADRGRPRRHRARARRVDRRARRAAAGRERLPEGNGPARFSFALVGVAAARFGGETRLALAGVAPIPWLLASPDELERATPLPGTAFKVDLARPLIRRALEAVGA